MDISYGFSNSSNKMIKTTFSHCWFLYSVSILAALFGSIIDLVIIGNFLDDDCVAATGIAAPLFFLYIAIASMFYSGGLTRISYHLGKYDADMANRIYTRTMIWELCRYRFFCGGPVISRTAGPDTGRRFLSVAISCHLCPRPFLWCISHYSGNYSFYVCNDCQSRKNRFF